MDEFRDYLKDYVAASFARARKSAGLAPMEKVALNAAEHVVGGAIDELFARLKPPTRKVKK